MARGTQHRKRRPRANAGVVAPAPKPKRSAEHPSWEDQLFFSRLRVHAKPVFLLLAIVFGATFIFLGVGSGTSGITDAMQNLFSRSSGGGSSLSSLQKKAAKSPKDAVAWRNLVTKLEQDQKTDRALVALEHYLRLKPKDESALQELAGMYSARAQDYNILWGTVLGQLQVLSPSGIFQPTPSSPFGKAFANQDPLNKLLVDRLQARSNAASQRFGDATAKAESAYKRLVKVAPANATYQFQYGSIAQALGHKAPAIAAYKKFLKLAPNDTLASRARAELKTLTAPATKK